MKALVLTGVKEPLQLLERPDPPPGEGEVLVRLKAAALNRRDYFITQGLYPRIQTPVILGSDGAGVVTKLGDGVDPLWQDREVLLDPGLSWGDNPAVQSSAFHVFGMPTDGTFATHIVVPTSQLHAKPGHLNWFEAAALPLAGVTAFRATFVQGKLKAGETVLITGVGGGVATFALQFAVATGARVLVTSSSPQKLQRASALGAAGGYDYTQPNWVKELQNHHGQPSLIIDGAGGDGYMDLLTLAAPGGRIVNYGATAGAPEKFDLFRLFWKQLHIIGSTLGTPEDFRAMLDFVAQHRIKPVIDQVFPLSAGQAAIEQMKTSPQFGKLALDCASHC